MEEALAAWVNKLGEANKVVLSYMIRSRALVLFSEIYQVEPSQGKY